MKKKLVPVAKRLVQRIERDISDVDLATTRRTLQHIMRNLDADLASET